jgi:enoyl-CoA hydratase/carnithine racemase
VFSAGNDLQEFLHPGQHPGPDSAVMVLLRTVAAFDKPLMACVCGPAVGIGTTLLLHCDLVVAGDNAMFALPFINLGVCPEAASSLLLPQRIGMARAAELLMLGEPFGAQSAEEWGLINRVVPPTEASAVAALMARKLAEKPLDSLMTTKRLLRQTQQAAVMQHLHTEMEEFARLLKAPAAREAMQAFLEKRKPNFSSL